MKRHLKRFRRLFERLIVLICVASWLFTGSASAQETSGLEAMQLDFPVQRIGSAQSLPPVNNPTATEYREQYLQTSATLDTGVTKMSRRLANLTWEHFEQKLVDLWGDRIQARAEDPQGSRVRILIPGGASDNNQMVIDRTHNAVTFEGDPQVAQNWDALIDLLDRVEDDRHENVRLVGLGHATPATVRRAIGLLGIPEDESSSLSEALQFAPFRATAHIAEPQRNSQLRSIPFRPASNNHKKKPTNAQGPRPRTAPSKATPVPLQPTPPRAASRGKSAAGGDASGDVTGLEAPASSAAAPSSVRPRVTDPARPIPSVPAMTASSKEANAPTAPLKATTPPANASSNSVPATAIAKPARTQPETSAAKITAQPKSQPQPKTTTPTRSLTYSAPRQEEGNRGMNIVELQEDPMGGPEGTVKIRVVPELNAIVLIGAPEDVRRVKEMIRNIISTAGTSQPTPTRYPVRFADAATLKATIDEIYEAAYLANNGPAEIIAISNPNSLLVVAQDAARDIIKGLIDQLDVETPETDETLDFRVFKLKHMSAVDAATRLSGYFRPSEGENDIQQVQTGSWIASVEGLVSIIIEYRSNSVIVKGNQRVLRNAEQLLAQIDVAESDTTHVVKFFKVYNTLASDIAIILQNAINGQLEGAPQARTNGQGVGQQLGQDAGGGAFVSQARANLPVPMLKMTTINNGSEITQSGILLDVKVTADANSNQLIITGPESSMDLISALIKQLDRIPDAETQIKVFTVNNGDATQLLDTLTEIFGADQTQAGGGVGGQTTNANLPLQTSSMTPGASLINLRFGLDPRTNSIIASGPAGDLQLIEDLLNRLDEADLSNRINFVFKLSNAPAEDVALAINNWLAGRQEVVDADPTTNADLVNARRQVVVVEELITNSLIISATPTYFDEVMRLIQELDRRPPMVKIKVMLAEVSLNKLKEFGVEVGIQDSLLFDRGTGVIGFPFNQAALGNNSDALSLSTREFLAGQALSNLNIGRTNNTLGYGGMVLSAGNESINVLLRALQDRSLARVLSTPDIMTVENLQGRVQVGQKVARVTGGTTGQFGSGVTTTVEDVDVGVILSVTPRVSPDGMIIMAVDAVNSELGDEADGTPVFIDGDNLIRSPPINIIQAQTTIMARSGQTVAFSGLIQDTTAQEKRGTPILSDLPVIGPLFSFERDFHERDELLIILTPYLVDDEAQIEASNQAAMSRMNWCLADVAEVYGSDIGYGGIDPEHLDSYQPPTYYPDEDPTGQNPQYMPLEGEGSGQPGQFPQEVFDQPTAPPQMPQPAPSPSDTQGGSAGLLNRLVPGIR